MDTVSLGVPQQILDVLPDEGVEAGPDMKRVVESWQERANTAIETADADRDAARGLADVIESLEERHQRYDDHAVELRAWGQSPIYAIAWRNLYADLIAQLYEHDDLDNHLNRERNARIVEDGIRFGE